MNARQMKKNLKKQIEKLKSDNNLMRGIIDDSPSMSELYDVYNKPVNINISTIDIQEYRTKRLITPLDYYEFNRLEIIKKEITNDLMDDIKKCINFELTNEYNQLALIASIFIGRKRG